MEGFVAYAGRSGFHGDRVVHHLELSLFPNWAGTDQQIGVVFPTLELIDPGAVRDYAQAAEGLGYAHLTAWEPVVGVDLTTRPDSIGPPTLQPIHEPLVLFGHLAAVTRRLELVTGVPARPSARRCWWPNRPPRSTCCRGAGCA